MHLYSECLRTPFDTSFFALWSIGVRGLQAMFFGCLTFATMVYGFRIMINTYIRITLLFSSVNLQSPSLAYHAAELTVARRCALYPSFERSPRRPEASYNEAHIYHSACFDHRETSSRKPCSYLSLVVRRSVKCY